MNRNKIALEDLEQFLHVTMRPVTPRPEFVGQLRNLLAEPINASLPRLKMEKNHYLFFALATVLSGLIILFTTSRLILAIRGAIGLARYIKN
jgi:hypothetical protein